MTIRPIAVLLLVTAVQLSSACTAAADPPTQEPTRTSERSNANTFPDMSSFTAANPEEYKWESDNPGRPTKLTNYGFSTPDGVHCGFGQLPSASCSGNNLPSVPAAECNPRDRAYGQNEISTNAGLRQVSNTGCAESVSSKVLPPFHKLTVFGVMCGVDDKGTTACVDPLRRGFVLSPSWSGWLPKV